MRHVVQVNVGLGAVGDLVDLTEWPADDVERYEKAGFVRPESATSEPGPVRAVIGVPGGGSYEDAEDDDLRAEAGRRDLVTTGTRRKLIERLEANDVERDADGAKPGSGSDEA